MQARNVARQAAAAVAASGAVHTDVLGDADQKDSFFGTIVEPTHVLAWPVLLSTGVVYAVIVLQRQSMHAFGAFECDVVAAVAKRLALGVAQLC
jgi:hypothetical protein